MTIAYRDTDGTGKIGCLTYQSRAVSPPSEDELFTLVQQARRRNHRVGVTGMLLYEGGHFLQTLEGPPAGLDVIWSSIRRDQRHANIEVLTEHLVSARLFSEWDLLFYRKLEQAPKTFRERLAPAHPLNNQIPTIMALALAGETEELAGFLAGLAGKRWDGDDIARHLIEPAARTLGDAWLTDDCSEFDLVMALGVLQSASHAIHYDEAIGSTAPGKHSILLASAPGEPHMIGPSLMADRFTDAGWSTELTFPETDEALAKQLFVQRPQAVDISLSDALARPGLVSRLRKTVKQSRWAVPNKPIIVTVGGRIFAEGAATAEHVGADLARRTMAGSVSAMTELIEGFATETRLSSKQPSGLRS